MKTKELSKLFAKAPWLLNVLPLLSVPRGLTSDLHPGMKFTSMFLYSFFILIPLPEMFSIHSQSGEILLMFKATSRNHIQVLLNVLNRSLKIQILSEWIRRKT